MPAFQFDNEEAFLAWMSENKDKLSAITGATRSPPVQTTDAAQVRQVTQEVQRQVLAPPPAETRLRPQRNAFTQSDATASNAIRLAVGEQAPRSTANKYGMNFFIPTFAVAHHIMNILAHMLSDTKMFYDQSGIYHPLLAHLYLSIVGPLFVLKVMSDANVLDADLDNWLESTLKRFPLAMMPIPGPLKNFFLSLAFSKSGVPGYSYICPWLPRIPGTTTNAFGIPHGNNVNTHSHLTGRLSSPLALLDQYRRFLTFVNTPAAAALPSPQTVARWPSFLHTVLGQAVLAAAPTAIREQTAVNAGLNPTRTAILMTPGFTEPIYTSVPIASNLKNNVERILEFFPAPAANANPLTWNQFFGFDLNNGIWFEELCESMSLFCKHFSDSTLLSEIATVGHTGGQVLFTPGAPFATWENTAANPAPAPPAPHRFPHRDFACAGSIHSPVVADADLFDTAVYFTNCDQHFAGSGGALPAGSHRTGPFWTRTSVLEDVPTIAPTEGIRQIVREHYYIARPSMK